MDIRNQSFTFLTLNWAIHLWKLWFKSGKRPQTNTQTKTLYKVAPYSTTPLIQMKTFPLPACVSNLISEVYIDTQKPSANEQHETNFHETYDNEQKQ